MKGRLLRQTLAACTLFAGAGLLLPGCVDNSYDLSEDLDLTMALGSEGLSLKLGKTQQILLNDLLDTDKSVKLDGKNLYYLCEEGSTDVDFTVDNVTANVENSQIKTAQRVLDFNSICQQSGVDPSAVSSVPIAGGEKFSGTAKSAEKEKISFHLEDANNQEIKQIDKVTLERTPVTLSIEVKKTDNVKLKISKISGMRITMPEYLRVENPSNGSVKGNVLTLNDIVNPTNGKLVEVSATALDFGKEALHPDKNGDWKVEDDRSQVGFEGNVEFETTGSFTMGKNDYADIVLNVRVGTPTPGTNHSAVKMRDVTGRFNPEINPEINPIDIKSGLPDFLADDEVAIKVANPTLKFVTDFTQIPADLTFSAELEAVKNAPSAFKKAVTVPGAGKSVTLKTNQPNIVYFHESAEPYNPDGAVEANAQKVRVNAADNRLSSLIEKIPDEIRVNLQKDKAGKPRVSIPQDKSYTIKLGTEYKTKADYHIYVPFEFGNGLSIVYRDSTESMEDDLKGMRAQGVEVKANVVNTIPLALVGKISALDKAGNPMPGVKFDNIAIKAADDKSATAKRVVTPVHVTGTLANPADLERMDKLAFRIEAANGINNGTHELKSTQYIQFEDIRLKLKGKVTSNFN